MFPNQGNVKGLTVSDDSADEYDWDVTFDPPLIPPRVSYFTPTIYSSHAPLPPPFQQTQSRPSQHGPPTGVLDSGDSDLEEEYPDYAWHNSPVYTQKGKVKGSPKRRRRFKGIFAPPTHGEYVGMNGHGEEEPLPFSTFRNVSESSSCESTAPTEYFSFDMDMGGGAEGSGSVTDIVGAPSIGQTMSGHRNGSARKCPCCHQVISPSTQLTQLDHPCKTQSESKDKSTSTVPEEDFVQGDSSIQFIYRRPVGETLLDGTSENAFDSFPYGSNGGRNDQGTSTLTLRCDYEYQLAKKTLEKLDGMTGAMAYSPGEYHELMTEGDEDNYDDIDDDDEIIELVDRSTSTPSLPSQPEWAHASTSTSTLNLTLDLQSKEVGDDREGDGTNPNFDLMPRSHDPVNEPLNSNGDATPLSKLTSGIPRCIKGKDGHLTPPPSTKAQGQVGTPSRIPRKVPPAERQPSLIPKPKRGSFCPITLRIEK